MGLVRIRTEVGRGEGVTRLVAEGGTCRAWTPPRARCRNLDVPMPRHVQAMRFPVPGRRAVPTLAQQVPADLGRGCLGQLVGDLEVARWPRLLPPAGTSMSCSSTSRACQPSRRRPVDPGSSGSRARPGGGAAYLRGAQRTWRRRPQPQEPQRLFADTKTGRRLPASRRAA